MQMTIDLVPIARSDLPLLLSWRNDWRIIEWTRQSDLLNEVEHEAWYDKQALDPTISMYKIVLTTADEIKPVGVCGLTSIDHRNSRAEFSLYIAPGEQKQGVGKNSLSLLLKHAFLNLGLNLVWGESFDGNPAIKMFEALGMVNEGTRRAFYFKDGKRVNAHLYSITRDEWHGTVQNRDTSASVGEHLVGDCPVSRIPVDGPAPVVR